MSKTKVMMETDNYIKHTHIENFESNVYLGQRYSTRYKNQAKEIQRGATAAWTAFAKHRNIFKGDTGTCLKSLQHTRTSSSDLRRGEAS